MHTDTLTVPGATLYHEVRGSGPVLLLICGGIYDAAGYAGLAERLADRYTVVTYDRRGNSRSPLSGPPEPQSIRVHADDAERVLSAVGDRRPAYVFGNSSGALIGLDLAARYPQRVRVLVAHEPPVFELLADRDHWRAVVRQTGEAFRAAGAGAAMGVFAAGLAAAAGPDNAGDPAPAAGPDDAEPGDGGGVGDPEAAARMGRNLEFFIGYEVPPFGRYVPDFAALRASGVRVVPAVGDASAGEGPHRGGLAVAEHLGAPAVVLPGDHGGFGGPGPEFGKALRAVLAES